MEIRLLLLKLEEKFVSMSLKVPLPGYHICFNRSSSCSCPYSPFSTMRLMTTLANALQTDESNFDF